MKKITEVTRKEIFDLLEIGFVDPVTEETKHFWWSGSFDEVAFLKRLYELNLIPSTDKRYRTADDDIYKHRIANDDWPTDWVFYDSRFNLIGGDDEELLRFICEMFHPAVRIERQPWQEFLSMINDLLAHDGYELFEKDHISNRSLYGWREISNRNAVIESQSERIKGKFDSDYMNQQIQIMNDTVQDMPYEAIGKAKGLMESCFKTILKEREIDIDPNWDIIRLNKEVCKVLQLTPEDISSTVKASDIIKRLLGNLSAVSHSMAELRNSYGSGHGKEASFRGLSPRHARLAIGSAVSVVHFMWETHEERQASSDK